MWEFSNRHPYGNPFSNQSATNPYATEAPRLSDQEGNSRGKLSANQYDPDSVSTPTGDMAIRILPTHSTIELAQAIPIVPTPHQIPMGVVGGLKGGRLGPF